MNRLEDRLAPSATSPIMGPMPPSSNLVAVPAFTDLAAIPPSSQSLTPALSLTDMRAVSVNLPWLQDLLEDAPFGNNFSPEKPPFTLSLPTPDGMAARFKVWEVSIVEPGYVTLNPDMRTYVGQGIDDPYASLAADIGSTGGFHASVRSPHGSWYIDPYYHLNQSVYAVYDREDMAGASDIDCGSDHLAGNGVVGFQSPAGSGGNTSGLLVNGSNIISYRLAVAATAEYTAFHGGTVANAEAAIKSTIMRVNQVYEPELAVRLLLVANNNDIIFTDTNTDKYTNGNTDKLIDENQTKITAVIGSANYDIGHVFDHAGAAGSFSGLAGLGVVGNDSKKARGVSTGGTPSSTNHPFIECVLHEMGHQFGAHHTFNGVDSGLLSQRDDGSAYEPGAGTTIMSYGYNAASNPVNTFQGFTDDYFHITSLNEITDYIATIPSVGSKAGSGNTPPVANAGSEYTIPARTPFVLTGSGTDADNDPLTYTWEQFDLDTGSGSNAGSGDPGSGPLFRSVLPTPTGNVRYFPNLATVLDGFSQNSSNSEQAITTTRDLVFRLTARDNRPDRGAYHSSSTQIHAKDTGSGFGITNFNSFGVSVYAGTTQTVTWDVAGTTGNGINTNLVIIDLSTDGGNTFTNVSSFEANDGSADVTLPTNSATTKARFRVRPSGNIYYDISNVDFTIKAIPTTITVLNNNDSGPNSLREAIQISNEAPTTQTIVFSAFVFGTITLNSELAITDAVTINYGPGSGSLTISGNNNSRIFNTDAAPSGASIKISGLTLTAGKGIDGGAIYIGDEDVTIEDSTITLCSATEDGGAINVQNAGTLTLLRSTISGNTAADDGGGIYFNNGGSADITETSIINNFAANGSGGGLYFFGSTGSGIFGLNLLHTTIAGNYAAHGGGGVALLNFSGTLDVSRSTVTGNSTFDTGGGGVFRGTTAGSTTINFFNSIVSGNGGPPSAPDVFSGGTVNVDYSAIGSTLGFTLTGGNNLIGQNLKLRPLANNGGPTSTVAFEWDSPLRDKGSTSAYSTDQRGLPRDANGIDIGAFELQSTVTNTNNSGLGSLRDAVAESDRVVGVDTINFSSLFDTVQIINLQTGEVAPTDAVTIQGKGESLTLISGLGISRIFNTTGVAAGKTVTLRGLRLTGGKTSADGGAILVDDEVLVVEDSSIHSSSATGSGGAISVGAAGKLTLLRSSLIGNTSSGVGGAVRFVNGGNSEINSSALISNKSGIGGAIHITGTGSNITVINSTLSGNSAVFGGGIALEYFNGALTVRNTTIVGNSSSSGGGGIDSFKGTPNINVESTIVSGNIGKSASPDISSTTKLNVNRSAIGTTAGFTFTGSNNLPFGANLKLGALATNGGTTLNYLPANDSPLINAGSNPAGLGLDQRGAIRTLFGATDIGSVESTNAPPDTTAPTILSITSATPNGSYGPGSSIDIIVNFSEPVTLVGTLNVLFNNGGVGVITAQQPNFSTLTGTYTVASGQATADLNVTGFTLPGGSTLRDAAGNDALYTLPSSNFGVNKDIVITTPDASAPTITSITSPTPNGTYQAGANIAVNLNFSEPVTLSGFLFVFFDSGGSLIITGPQTSSTLSGTYTVGANQNSPDLNVTAVALDNTSFLTDAAGNQALLTLPASNLANNSNIVVGTPVAATFTVTNVNNSGAGSLRQAVLDANASPGYDVIVFDASFNTAQTITLSTNLDITEAVAITGKGATLTTIQGGGSNRLILTQNAPAGATINISGLTLTGGVAGNGGGVFIGDENVTFSNSILSNHFTSGTGGAIIVQGGGKITLIASTLSGNTASFGGGIGIFTNGSADIRESSLINNRATANQGGGLYFGGAVGSGGLRLLNSTVSGNSANTYGGGVGLRNFTGKFEAISSTIFNNTSSYLGGGISRNDTGTGTIFLRSAIVSGNTATVGGHDLYSTTGVDAAFSAIGKTGGFTLSNNVFNLAYGTDLKLGALAANGGPTLTHRPTGDSPLLNAGTSYYNVSTDQRGSGFPRQLDGAPDIGAVEVPFVLPTVVLNANDSGIGSLRQAILNANSNPGADTVTFDPTFFATAKTITLTSGQMIFSDTTGATTVVGAGLNLLTLSGNNVSRLFAVTGNATVALSGMTLANGNSVLGGAIQNNVNGNLTVDNTRFTNNKSDYGGAIYNVGALNVSNCTFDNNAANAGPGWGGAIVNGTTVGATNITSCTFTNNSAAQLGGAVLGYSFNITNSTFTNNTSDLNGGAIRTDGTLLITGSTFSGNSAANDGGAIMSHGTTTITNSTLASNTASIGGGIFFFEGTGTLRNVTVAYNTSKNTAGNIGGGSQVGTAASVAAVNTVVAGNTAASGLNAGGVFNASSSNNLLNLSAADAGLDTLASNGGPTQTIALLPGSPAINAGTSVGVPTTDQRGLNRVGATDIGAFEAQPLQPANVYQVTINGGAVQRSRVTTVTVTFNHPVTFVSTPAAAFQLQRQSDGKLPSLNASVNAARDVVTLTFLAGDAVDFGSLADGRYTLTIQAAQFASDGFDGDGNGLGGDNYTLTGTPANGLFRLFGDADGDGTVAASDFIQFRLALGGSSAIFDFDNDGAVAASDFIQFRLRFGGSI